MTSYFVIEKGNQVISKDDHFFFVNDYGRTELENPPQNGFPAYYKQTENNPAQECGKTAYIDFLEGVYIRYKRTIRIFPSASQQGTQPLTRLFLALGGDHLRSFLDKNCHM